MNTVTEAINALRNTAVAQTQPQARLTKQAYYASLRANPPVYVVPDRGVPAKTWQEHVADLMNVISAYRAKTPVYTPFPAGTKTLQARATEAEMASQALRDALAEAQITGYYKGKPTWEREYATKQLALAASRAAQPKTVSPKQQYESLIYNKLLAGQPLTDIEKVYLFGSRAELLPPETSPEEQDVARRGMERAIQYNTTVDTGTYMAILDSMPLAEAEVDFRSLPDTEAVKRGIDKNIIRRYLNDRNRLGR